jgi:hypothetical protein
MDGGSILKLGGFYDAMFEQACAASIMNSVNWSAVCSPVWIVEIVIGFFRLECTLLKNLIQFGFPFISELFFWYIWWDEFIVILTGTWSESSSARGSYIQVNGTDLSIRISKMSRSQFISEGKYVGILGVDIV